MNWIVTKYKGEWAIYDKESRAYVLFGSKKVMTERAKELNSSDVKKHGTGTTINSSVKKGDIVYVNTGVAVKVLEYDSKFGGRVLIERADGIKGGKPMWKPLSKFSKTNPIPKMSLGGKSDSFTKASKKAKKEIDFLITKGYSIDSFSTENQDVVFGDDDNFIFATQGSKRPNEKSLEFAIAYLYENEESGEMQINESLLDSIADGFSNFKITLYTNAGVDIHSKNKGKYKNIEVVKVPFDKFENGGSLSESFFKFSPKDYKKLISSDKFETREDVNFIVIKEKGRSKTLGKFAEQQNILYVFGEKDLSNALVVWLKENSYIKNEQVKKLSKGSKIRADKSSLLKYVNFEDNWHINLLELTSNRNNNGLKYKNKNQYAVVRSSKEKGQEVFEFKTLSEAEEKFEKLVEKSKTYSKVVSEGKTNNYEKGGNMPKSFEYSIGGL